VIVLKNGVKYYEGPVDGISQTFGYFELKSKNLETLKQFLEGIDQVKSIEKEQDTLKVFLNADLQSEELSEKLAKAQIFVSHLAKKKPSLEDQFLTLTQTK
jgi:ABC-2 type transport system ATP-binding protein